MFLLAAWWWEGLSGPAGVLVGVVATVIVAAVVFYLQRDKKTFDWQLLTNEPIMTTAPAQHALGKITVTLNGREELKHPRLLTIRLINTGKREIRPEDFDGEVIVVTEPHLAIKSASPVRNREGMRHMPGFTGLDDHTLIVDPILYNRGDWVDIQLLVDVAEDMDELSPFNLNRVTGWDKTNRPKGRFLAHGTPTREVMAVSSTIAGQTRRGRQLSKFNEDSFVRVVIALGTGAALASTVSALIS